MAYKYVYMYMYNVHVHVHKYIYMYVHVHNNMYVYVCMGIILNRINIMTNIYLYCRFDHVLSEFGSCLLPIEVKVTRMTQVSHTIIVVP